MIMHLNIRYTIAVLFLTCSVIGTNDGYNEDIESRASEFINKLDRDRCLLKHENQLAALNFRMNMNRGNRDTLVESNSKVTRQKIIDGENVAKFEWQKFHNESLKRMFMKYSGKENAKFTVEKTNALNKAHNKMRIGGPKSIVKFAMTEYVRLKNEASRARNFSNTAEQWLSEYEQDEIEVKIIDLWNQIKPLYTQLHAYIRKKLFDRFGPKKIDRRGPIPNDYLMAFLSGKFAPYPKRRSIDIADSMEQQNYTVMKMAKMAEDFFVSINLTSMSDNFWNNSIFEYPRHLEKMNCNPIAGDLFTRNVFIIMGCFSIDQFGFERIHHQMALIEYFEQYKNQPCIFRAGANPGFYEAIGEMIVLSATSHKHLKRVGLLEDDVYDDEMEINNLLQKAQKVIGHIPLTLTLDAFRHSVFRGETTANNYDCIFGTLVEKFQGFEPAKNLSGGGSFAARYEYIVLDVETLQYIVSTVTQFQFHRSLCQKAGQYDPKNSSSKLSNCDIYGSAEAGNVLKAMMSLGSSRPWPEAMELITGQRDMDASALLEYFKPLQLWLEKENAKTNEYIGWEKSTVEYCNQEKDSEDKNNKNEPKHTAEGNTGLVSMFHKLADY